jgi:hypothetical protein
MSHKHDRLIRDIFQDPVSGNIHWCDVESLLHHLGSEVVGSHGAVLHVVLNGVEAMMHRPHHGGTCSKQDIRHLREFLISAGIRSSGSQARG